MRIISVAKAANAAYLHTGTNAFGYITEDNNITEVQTLRKTYSIEQQIDQRAKMPDRDGISRQPQGWTSETRLKLMSFDVRQRDLFRLGMNIV